MTASSKIRWFFCGVCQWASDPEVAMRPTCYCGARLSLLEGTVAEYEKETGRTYLEEEDEPLAEPELDYVEIAICAKYTDGDEETHHEVLGGDENRVFSKTLVLHNHVIEYDVDPQMVWYNPDDPEDENSPSLWDIIPDGIEDLCTKGTQTTPGRWVISVTFEGSR